MRRILMLMGAAVLPLVAGSVGVTARFDRADLACRRVSGSDVLDLGGYPALIDPGAPRVPEVVQSVLIPAGAFPTGVELIAEDWITLPGTYSLPPSQPDAPLPTAGRPATPPRLYPRNAVTYASVEPYPAAKIRLLQTGTMSGYRIANVELHPLRYVPATGKVMLATRLTYRLSYEERPSDGPTVTVEQHEVFGRAVRRLVVNPEDVARFAPRTRIRSGRQGLQVGVLGVLGGSTPKSELPPGDYPYVIITEAPMDTVFQRLADWKTAKGLPGNVTRISWIEANYVGWDVQDRIRNFIKDARETWGTIYVLLGGQGDYTNSGQNIVPTRMAKYDDNTDEPCDLYYAGLDGNWDANGNQTYGELDDSVDMYSDVYVGRAPVYNVTMAQTFVAKVLSYEQNPPAGYLKKLLLPTAILWDAYEERPMAESIARMAGPGWTVGRLYERNGTLSPSALVDSLNLGWGLSHWDAFGEPSELYMSGGAYPLFTSDDADALTNRDKTGLAISIASYCGAWDEVPGGDCLAEHLVNNPNGGMVAAVMNTLQGFGGIGPEGNYVPGPSERLDTTFFSAVFGNLNHAGEALAYAKSSWVPYADSLYRYAMQRYCIYDLTLFGDPELPLWTDEPVNPTVEHPDSLVIGVSVPCTVTVSRSGTPVESALVTLTKANEVHTQGRTNSSGRVTLYVSAQTPGPMLLTVNARNCLVQFDTVCVVSIARYVMYLRSEILDPAPGGNGDSILNPGESVKVQTWVENWGLLTAHSVSALLRTHDSNAQITDSARSFGDIGPGDSASTGENGFGLHVSAGLANGYPVLCTLYCRDALDTIWVSPVTFYVGLPVLDEIGIVIYDPPHGNGRIDPGETCDVEIKVGNTGLGNAYNCRGVLRSSDPRLAVLGSLGFYGLIRNRDSASNRTDRFRVAADPLIHGETPIPCTLLLSADGGYQSKAAFPIIVSEIRTIDPIPDGPRVPPLYYAYDDVDLLYAQHPDYDWVEINRTSTLIQFTSSDGVAYVPLPLEFGPLKFYGWRFVELSVSADGWVSPGMHLTPNARNVPLPDTNDPPGMICANWSDLSPVSTPGSPGGVYYLHDAQNHRFVIEYDSVAYLGGTRPPDKFEIVVYDTTVATLSGDNRIDVEYMTANSISHSTLGIEDPTEAIAITAFCNGSYNRGCAPLVPGRAIRYATGSPMVGIGSEKSAIRNPQFSLGRIRCGRTATSPSRSKLRAAFP